MEECKTTKNGRIGETIINYQGEEMIIIEYNNYDNITVQFKSTKEIIKTTYSNFNNGKIKSHFSPTVYGIGTTGITQVNNEDGKVLDSYEYWKQMLRRCYSAKFQEKYPTYIGCTVSEEFKTYDNFKKFYDENYYEILELGHTELDKDILHKNNKTYSKDNCIFIPQTINKLFTKRQNDRGDLPIGVSLSGKKYRVRCCVENGESQYLGTFITPDIAFNVYKEFKENLIKRLANEYKNQIPVKLYEALMNYIVEITD